MMAGTHVLASHLHLDGKSIASAIDSAYGNAQGTTKPMHLDAKSILNSITNAGTGVPTPPAYTVTNKALTSNVATLTVGATDLVVGESVLVTGVDATFNGTFVLTAVTPTTISYALVAANVVSVASGGTVEQVGPEATTITSHMHLDAYSIANAINQAAGV